MPPRSSQRTPQLQLSAILSQLRRVAEANAPVRSTGAGAPVTVTVGEIADRTGQAGFGVINALLALVAIPFMGVSTPFGLTIALVALQMIVGLHRPWLPQRIRRHAVSVKTLEWLGTRLARWTGGLERIVRPRLPLLTRGPFWTLCGVAILVQGLGLALPLPIPASNWFFIVPIVLYSIGLLESDGLLIVVCHVLTATQAALVIVFWEVVAAGLHATFQWFAHLAG